MIEKLVVIEETGVSADYITQYAGHDLSTSSDGKQGLVNSIKQYPVKKYEERFPQAEFGVVVNDENRATVSRLDEIADTVNSKFIDPNIFTVDDWKILINEVYILIYGANSHKPYTDIEETLEQ